MTDTTHVQSFIRQIGMSRQTFGPSERADGVIDHIISEFEEIKAEIEPFDRALEWVDVVILARDGFWRALREAFPDEGTRDLARRAVEMIEAKQDRNDFRDWPDYRTADPDKSIEHVRSAEEVVARRAAGLEPVLLEWEEMAGNEWRAERGGYIYVIRRDGRRAPTLHIYPEDDPDNCVMNFEPAMSAPDGQPHTYDAMLARAKAMAEDFTAARQKPAIRQEQAPAPTDGVSWDSHTPPPEGFMVVHDTQRGFVLRATAPRVLMQSERVAGVDEHGRPLA